MSKKKETKPVIEILQPIPCGECRDLNGKRIGRYIYLESEQEMLDSFFDCWINTYNSDNNFFVTLDLETQGLDFIIDSILLVSICWNGSDALVFDPINFNLDKFKEFLNTVPISNHNIKFDFKFLKSKYNVNPIIYFDTLTAAQMAFAGSLKLFGLSELVEKILTVYKISKETRNTFIGKEEGTSYSREQIEYAARDSILTHQLVRPIIKRLVKNGSYTLWDKVDRNVLQLLVDSEFQGVRIDYEKLKSVYQKMQAELIAIDDKLQQFVNDLDINLIPKKYRGKKFNAVSPTQIAVFLKIFGLEVDSTSKDILNDLRAKNDCEFLNTLIDYKVLHAQVTKQMKKWLDESYNPITHSAHPNFFVNGAVTGRLSCASPPLQQVPKNLRHFVIANDNKSFVCMDYSSFEFRACAARSGEQKLIDALFKREEQMPIAKELCSNYTFKDKSTDQLIAYDDPDEWMKDVMKKKIDLRNEDTQFFREFIATDIHCINAASAFKKPVWECDASDRQIGKAQPLYSKVLTPSGWKLMGDLKIGDEVCTPSGEISKIINIFPQGVKPTYEITFSDGRKTRACKEHLWEVEHYVGRKKVLEIVTTEWMEQNLLRPNRGKESNIFVKCISPVIFNDCHLPLDPYVLGVWLGDGHITKEKEVFITTTDNEIVEILQTTMEDFHLAKTSSPITYRLARPNSLGSRQTPSMGAILSSLGLGEARSNTKFIPECYLQGTPENRVALLQGLMDTDGYVTINGQTSFCTVSEQLKNNVVDLVRSLGGKCSVNEKLPFYRKNDEKIYGQLAYSINIQLPYYINLFNINKKVQRYNVRQQRKRNLTLSVKDIKLVGNDEMQCILIDHPEHLYVTDEFIPTHNTLGYAVLYGAGPEKIRETCIKESKNMSLEAAGNLIKTFYDENPAIKKMMQEIIEEVISTHSISTKLGRRRFFQIAPKWQSDRRKKDLTSAIRQAGNYVFQACNADATKLAMVKLNIAYKELWDDDSCPVVKLNVHDEIVTECNTEDVEKVKLLKKPIMIEAGRIVTDFKVPIDVSVSHGHAWVN